MHSLEENEGRAEEMEEEVDRDRYEEGDEIVNFLWVAVRTVVVVEDGPEAEAVWTCVTKMAWVVGGVEGLGMLVMVEHYPGPPEDGPGAMTSVDGPEDGSGVDT